MVLAKEEIRLVEFIDALGEPKSCADAGQLGQRIKFTSGKKT